MIPYASASGAGRTMRMLGEAGWHILIVASDLRPGAAELGIPYALENGGWAAHTAGQPFDEQAFAKSVEAVGARADWISAPDIVMGGRASFDLSVRWLPRLEQMAPGQRILFVAQDGFERPEILEQLAPMLGDRLGIFIGGSTEWKEGTLPLWGAVAAERGCWLHVGRVNTTRRVSLCAAAGATSFDGTSVSKFSRTLPKLDGARRQADLFRIGAAA